MKLTMSVQPHPDGGRKPSQVLPGSPSLMLMLPQDDRLTFLLPRPVWVNDLDVTHCAACDAAFGPLRRRHHCRHCGNIFCNDCSSKSAPLPQLGYGSKPVRVCKNCFEVAYLVTYAIDDDHGLSTQIHGARGLLELIEKDNPDDLHSLVAYGGVDALIWLCRSSTSTQLHHLVTTILAILAEKESVRPVIITKWALPALLHLIDYYIYASNNKQETKRKSPPQSIRSDSPGSPGNHSQISVRSTESSETARQEMILEIVINCTHIIYQLARAGILSSVNIVDEGVLDALLTLAAYDPDLAKDDDDNQSTGSKTGQEQDQLKERVAIIQSWAAKAASAISGTIANQPYVIDVLRGTNRFATLLRSSNQEVVKYMAKTIAYLSLRNDKYKAALLEGEVARALVSIIVTLPLTDSDSHDDDQHHKDLCFYLSCNTTDTESRTSNPAAVSHACCALANFATNRESQAILMSLPRVLKYICNVPGAFSDHSEIHRHIARCIANLALYDDNYNLMITTQDAVVDGKDAYNVIPTLLAMGQSANVTKDVQRHIVRAIDNLSAHVPDSEDGKHKWRDVLADIYPYIARVLEDSNDEDTLKRAQSIKDKVETMTETKKKKQRNKKKAVKEEVAST